MLPEATPYSDAEIQAILDAVNQKTGGRLNQQAVLVIGEYLRPLDPARLTIDHFNRLAALVMNAPVDVKDAWDARLAQLAEEGTIEGARAALWRADLANRAAKTYEEADRLKVPALWHAIHHPGFLPAVRAVKAGSVFTDTAFLNAETQWSSGLAQELTGLISPELSVKYASAVRYFAEKALTAKANAPEDRERLRQAAHGYFSAVLDSADLPERQRRELRLARDRTGGKAARGELIGRPAPPMTFLWSSGDAPPKRLADLRGKVVVLDFWATWCAPCRASFPKLKALQARYGDRVVVVGVTSVQGRHVNPKATGDVPGLTDTTGDAAREFRLMADFIRDAGITWRIAFSEQDAFNPDYGVMALPHVAIIDAKGVVRHNGLRIEDPEFEGKIDELLK